MSQHPWSSIALRLKIMIFAAFLLCIAVMALGLKNIVSLQHLSDSDQQHSKFSSEFEPLIVDVMQFIAEPVGLTQLQQELTELRTSWKNDPQLHQIGLDQHIAGIQVRLDQYHKLSQMNLELVEKMSVMLDGSITESNGYFVYLRDKWLSSASSISELEIRTMVGANMNTHISHSIRQLFLRFTTAPQYESSLLSLLNQAIENAGQDAKNLEGTAFADSPRKAMQINQQVQSFALEYAKNTKEQLKLKADLSQELQNLSDEVRQKMSAFSQVQLQQNQNAVILTISVVLLLSLLSVILALLIYRTTLPPVRLLVMSSAELAKGDGDLSHRIKVSGQSEIAALATNFNRFLETLAAMVSKVASSSAQLNQQISAVNTEVHHSNRLMIRQHAEIDTVATAVNQMAMSVAEVARNATETCATTDSTRQAADNGRTMVDQTVVAVRQVDDTLKGLEQTMLELCASAADITGIVEVIRSIAEQTNLLALNAAIEAARAGEQGRGFSVVADEVRVLAQRTQQSTDKIQHMISRLTGATSNAMEHTKSGSLLANQTLKQSEDVGLEFAEIARRIDEVAQRNNQIAVAVEQQSGVAEHISQSLTLIRDLSLESRQCSEKIEQVSSELDKNSSHLGSAIQIFKL